MRPGLDDGRLGEPGQLIVDGKADADIAPVSPQPRLLGAEGRVVDRRHDLLEADGIGRAVVHEPRGRGVGQIGGANQIGAPDLDRVEAERMSAQIEHALHHEGRGRPHHSAVGPGRCRVVATAVTSQR
jgi:hypothetical protein